MKRIIGWLVFVIALCGVGYITMCRFSTGYSVVGKKAPNIPMEAVVEGTVKTLLLDGITQRYKILFFYPSDFTFVCPTELHALNDALGEFEKRSAQVIAISVDSSISHQKWLEQSKNEGGIAGIRYPLVADTSKKLTRAYSVLDAASGKALRAVVIIDQDNVVQALTVYNLNVGRNIDEILRVLDAIEYVRNHEGEGCPANWKSGQQGLVKNQTAVGKYLAGQSGAL